MRNVNSLLQAVLVLLLSTFMLNCVSAKNPSEKKMKAYLMVYFKDPTHSLYMAISNDGYSFTDINDGKPVIGGDTIAEQKGIRDPHIYRGPDGAFYLAMTDLHIFAQRDGLRDTEWQRDGKKYGWGNNRALVLMKSTDLINWSRASVRIDEAFPELGDIGCAWAPETTYDPVKKKMMVYFTMRFGNERNKMYYSYVNDDFNKLETKPELIFEYPKKVSYIDADITKVDDKYHMFYTPHDGTPGIKHAVSDSVHTGYVYQEEWIDPEPGACEAPTVWKRIGEDKWVVMYDIYSIRPHNFGFSETTDFKTFKHLGHFNEGVMKATNFASPKHGAVIHLTKKEAKKLTNYWRKKKKNDLEADFNALNISEGYLRNLKWNIPLESIGKNGSEIEWKSDKPQYITDNGKLLKLSPREGEKITVTLTATLKQGELSKDKKFEVAVAHEDKLLDGYLFAYFEGQDGSRKNQEQLRFAVSADAKNWFALNDNKPILDSDVISQTGGIRDPHILRSEDEKSFFVVATDMSTATNGWKENPGIVMLKSNDLINWQHGVVDLPKQYPDKFANAYWVWAPQTVYDPGADKYLVYFTVRFKDDDKLDFYCAYANKEFNGFEDEPQFMFRAKYGAIDGDIIYKDGVYHLFFKGNTKDANGKEFENGIKQATATSLQGPWKEHFNYLDAYSNSRTGVEGSSIFKMNNSETYILMYDLYSSGRYEFQKSTDLYDFTQEPESFTKNFHPRHGSVIGITKDEANRLNKNWGGVPKELLSSPEVETH